MGEPVRLVIRHGKLGDEPLCPAVCGLCENRWGCIMGLDVPRDSRRDRYRKPGPDCPGPGEYVLVKRENWKAAWGLYLAHCPEIEVSNG